MSNVFRKSFSIVPHFHDLFVHSVCLFFLAHLLSPLIRKKTNYKHSNVHYRRHRQHLLLQTQSSSFITYPAIIIHHKPSTHHTSQTQPSSSITYPAIIIHCIPSHNHQLNVQPSSSSLITRSLIIIIIITNHRHRRPSHIRNDTKKTTNRNSYRQ